MAATPQEKLEAARRKVARAFLAKERAFATGSTADWEKAYERYFLALEAKDAAEWLVTTSKRET